MSLRTIAIVSLMMTTPLLAQTGPAVGEAIPDFEAVDQNGTTRDFASLAGENGLLLLFHRSADW